MEGAQRIADTAAMIDPSESPISTISVPSEP
jgi:hypothetical protein